MCRLACSNLPTPFGIGKKWPHIGKKKSLVNFADNSRKSPVNFSVFAQKSLVNFAVLAGKSQVNFVFLLKFFLTTKNMSARLEACRMPWQVRLTWQRAKPSLVGWNVFVVWPCGDQL